MRQHSADCRRFIERFWRAETNVAICFFGNNGQTDVPQRKSTDSDPQSFAERKYAKLKQFVERAGFFAPQIVGDDSGDHLVCSSKHVKGYGFTGRIAFISEVDGEWYLATPHPFHYRVLKPKEVGDAVVAFLSDASALGEHLIQIDDEEYEQALRAHKDSRKR